jgi:hypothetical protein
MKKRKYIAFSIIIVVIISLFISTILNNNSYQGDETHLINELCGNQSICANITNYFIFNFALFFVATKHLRKKFIFANNLFTNSNKFEFFANIILVDKKIVTHRMDNCQNIVS